MAYKIGEKTIKFENGPVIKNFASVCGKKESEGPLGKLFDKTFDDNSLGEKTWERSEGMLQKEAVNIAVKKSLINKNDLDFVFAGDLLNQCISSVLGLKDHKISFLGQFGACSTMAQTLIMASLAVESGAAKNAVAVTSSHFCSAERQYRFPLDYGGQRTPCAQWTVTGSGAMIVGKGEGLKIKSAVIGCIEDLGITDSSNMGAAMAPAAATTFMSFINDTGTSQEDFDLILTGDLGEVGSKLFKEILNKKNIDVTKKYNDCGLMIYYREDQDVHAGGSGCGCSAAVLCSIILQKMQKKELNNILFLATGALMSPTSFQQGETIPGIAHLVQISN